MIPITIYSLNANVSNDWWHDFKDFSLTLLQDSYFIFQQARGLSVYTSPCDECIDFFIKLLSYARHRFSLLHHWGLVVFSATLGNA